MEYKINHYGENEFTVVPKAVGSTTIAVRDADLSDESSPVFWIDVDVLDVYLNVGSTPIKGDYQSSDGTVSFDAASNTLTLNGAKLSPETVGTYDSVVWTDDDAAHETHYVDAIIGYNRTAPLNIVVKGENSIAGSGQNCAGIAVEPYLVDMTIEDGSHTRTGCVHIVGEDNASMTFGDCGFASIGTSMNMNYTEDGSENLSLSNLSLTSTDEGDYGIYAGREMGVRDCELTVANKSAFGISTGNTLTMDNSNIDISDIGGIGIMASGNGFVVHESEVVVKNAAEFGLSASAQARIESGSVDVSGCDYGLSGEFAVILGGAVKVHDVVNGMFFTMDSFFIDGSVDIASSDTCLYSPRTVLSGGSLKLVSDGGFALNAPGRYNMEEKGMDYGFSMTGGTLDAQTTNHAAFSSGVYANLSDLVKTTLPEGAKILSCDVDGFAYDTIADADTTEVQAVYHYTVYGAVLDDIAGAAEHVVIGTKKDSGWKQIDGDWYYYDPATGEPVSGWNKCGTNDWYYFDEVSHAMFKNTWAADRYDNLYFLDKDGKMVTGWSQCGTQDWYYFDQGGKMATGWLKWGGKWYFFAPKAGVEEDARNAMQTGWIKDAGMWYFLKADGSMAQSEWVRDAGKWYYLGRNGAMLRYEWLSWQGHWYWLKDQGEMAKSETINIGQGDFVFNAKGEWIG